MIAARAAEALHARVGDRLTVRYPVATGPRSYTLASASLPITGVHASPLRFVPYANTPAARTLGDQTMSQFTNVLIITAAIAMIMALLIAYNAAAINAKERTRETATMFAYGIRPRSVITGNVLEALLIGFLATILGIAAGYGILRWIIDVSMRETMPDLAPSSRSQVTYALAALAGIISFGLAPLFTLRRLKHTDISSALRVVE